MRTQPRTTMSTDTYIGFRDHRYGPVITSASGGLHGASVPLPVAWNSRTHQRRRALPAVIRATPGHCHTVFAMSAGAMRTGTTYATTPGSARNAKMARPTRPFPSLPICRARTLSDNVLTLRRGAPRRTRSVRTRRAMSAGPPVKAGPSFTRRPRRRKAPGSKCLLADAGLGGGTARAVGPVNFPPCDS